MIKPCVEILAITLRTCTRGKVIGLYVYLVVISTKIASSRDLDICACCKDNNLVNICEKLVSNSVCFELLNMAHKGYS